MDLCVSFALLLWPFDYHDVVAKFALGTEFACPGSLVERAWRCTANMAVGPFALGPK